MLEDLKEIVVTGAAAFTVWAAWQGLQTWRRQLKGQTEYDNARKLLRSAYAVRDAVTYIRQYRDPIERFDPSVARGADSAKLTEMYNNRWQPLREALSDFRVEKVGAEALWGSGVSNTVQPIETLLRDLHVATEQYLDQVDKHSKELEGYGIELYTQVMYSLAGYRRRVWLQSR